MKPCCANEKNLTYLENTKDRQVQRCKVCNNRHYRLFAEPGRLGATLKPLGR